MRNKNRKANELREIKITKNYLLHPEGSVLIEFGNTKVICTATVESKIPPFMKGKKMGWVHAEYSMLPRSTESRMQRESANGKIKGRTMEIQRLIARSLRSAIDLELLGEMTITVDCDVIQADGGTRTASITGGYIAMELAIQKLLNEKVIEKNPIVAKVAAISVGKVEGKYFLDLDYSEDSIADVDMNIVMNNKNEFIEIQGTGENTTFTMTELHKFLDLAQEGLKYLFLL